MARGKNTWIIIVLITLLIGFGVYSMWGSQDSNPKIEDLNAEEIEYVPSPDDSSDMEIIEATEDPAFQVGFGMGPGIYGSGRHTSEMVGN